MTDWIMTEEERRPDREIYYISEDDPVVKLMEAHKEALAEIERLKEALRSIADDINECTPIGIVARAALEGKDD